MRLFFILPLLIFGCSLYGQQVMKLKPGDLPAKATLGQLGWLTGYWKGTGLGGDCDELWMPASGSSMHGIFRLAINGETRFTEYMVIEEREQTLKVRLKHFGRDLSPWEEKEKWTEFKLVKVDGQTAWFHGLTYHRQGDELIIKLELKARDGTTIEEFRFHRATL